MSSFWAGPYVIREKLPNGINYQVQLKSNGRNKQIAHAGNMKKFFAPDQQDAKKRPIKDRALKAAKNHSDSEEEEADSDSGEETELEIDKIVDKGDDLGDLWYLVRWKGHGPDGDTWMRIGDLSNATSAIEEFERAL